MSVSRRNALFGGAAAGAGVIGATVAHATPLEAGGPDPDRPLVDAWRPLACRRQGRAGCR